MVTAKNTEYFRVIAGVFKGKKLRLPPSELTRSSKSILKESFFNTIQDEVRGKLFIEAFGGSGSVGIEALSRGASEAFFFELEKTALATLKSNLKELGCENHRIFAGDVFVNLPLQFESIAKSGKEAIYYFDPPFSIREGQEDVYEKCFALIEKLPKDSFYLAVIEHMSKEAMPQSLGEYTLYKTKRFGKSSLSYYKKGE